jgi:hypothetical protein
MLVRGAGLEPARPKAKHFKCFLYTNSNTRANLTVLFLHDQHIKTNLGTAKSLCYYFTMLSKTCTVCHETKLLTDYYWKDQSRGKYHAQCKACYKIKRACFMKAHYEKYGDQYRERARVRRSNIKRQRQDKLYAFLSDKCCASCGINDIRVLDFDHIDPSTKKFSIARGVNECYSWEIIELEIKKCRILCSNCHRIRTVEQYNWRKWHLDRMVR